MKNLGYIRKEEYTALEERVKELEARLSGTPAGDETAETTD